MVSNVKPIYIFTANTMADTLELPDDALSSTESIKKTAKTMGDCDVEGDNLITIRPHTPSLQPQTDSVSSINADLQMYDATPSDAHQKATDNNDDLPCEIKCAQIGDGDEDAISDDVVAKGNNDLTSTTPTTSNSTQICADQSQTTSLDPPAPAHSPQITTISPLFDPTPNLNSCSSKMIDISGPEVALMDPATLSNYLTQFVLIWAVVTDRLGQPLMANL